MTKVSFQSVQEGTDVTPSTESNASDLSGLGQEFLLQATLTGETVDTSQKWHFSLSGVDSGKHFLPTSSHYWINKSP